MITANTANEIVTRTKRMEDAEYCLAHITDVCFSRLDVSVCENNPMESNRQKYIRVEKKFDIDVKLLEIFLGNIRDYEKANLDELNYLAVQEAQDQIAEAQE